MGCVVNLGDQDRLASALSSASCSSIRRDGAGAAGTGAASGDEGSPSECLFEVFGRIVWDVELFDIDRDPVQHGLTWAPAELVNLHREHLATPVRACRRPRRFAAAKMPLSWRVIWGRPTSPINVSTGNSSPESASRAIAAWA